MGRIVAISGGYPFQSTLSIDKMIVDSARKSTYNENGTYSSKFLFLPTATEETSFFNSYNQYVHEHFGKGLGCKVESLILKNNPDDKEIENKIMNADIIYVSGGDPKTMIDNWNKTTVARFLKKAHYNGCLMTGISAGFECWFKHGLSDHKRMRNPNLEPKPDLEIIDMLGIIDLRLIAVAHRDQEDTQMQFKNLFKSWASLPIPYNAIVADDCTAIEIIDDKFRILSSKQGSNIYRMSLDVDNIIERPLEKNKFLSLSELSVDKTSFK